MLRTARHPIRAERHRHFTRSLSPESFILAAERDRGRYKNNQPMETTQHYCYTSSQLNCQLLNPTPKEKRNKLLKLLQICDYRLGARKFRKVVRSVNGSRSVLGRHPMNFGSKTITSDTDIAKAFHKQFTNARIHTSDKVSGKQNANFQTFSF